MGRDLEACAALVGVGGLDQEMVVVDRAEYAVLARARLDHLAAALDDLGEMPGRAPGPPRASVGIAANRAASLGAPGDHDLGRRRRARAGRARSPSSRRRACLPQSHPRRGHRSGRAGESCPRPACRRDSPWSVRCGLGRGGSGGPAPRRPRARCRAARRAEARRRRRRRSRRGPECPPRARPSSISPISRLTAGRETNAVPAPR